MSATKRGRRSVAQGSYPTPPEVTYNLMTSLTPRIPESHTILDPFAGEGVLLRVFKERGHPVVGVEIQERYGASLASLCDDYVIGDCFEALGDASTRLDGFTVVTNPDFAQASACIRRFACKCDRMAMLARQGLLSSEERYGLWQQLRPRRIYQMTDRPTFAWVCKNKAKDGDGNKACRVPPYPVGWSEPCSGCGCRVGPGNDATDYVWIEWGPEPALVTEFQWLVPCEAKR